MKLSISTLAAVVATLLNSTTAALTCDTQSQPNPIAAQYPTNTTGALNGTLAILPIELSLARSIIPSQYAILENSYRSLLPKFPKGMYPAMLQLELDHDVGASGLKIPDFSRASISFPFVDRLGDGYTAMTYGLNILIVATNPVAILGAGVYGNIVTPAEFDPPCDAYAYVPGTKSGETFFNAYVVPRLTNPKPAIGSKFAPLKKGDKNPYDLNFWKNVTNQPQFSSLPVCDNFIRFFNTTNNLPPFEPTPVKGDVSAIKPFFAKETTFEGVYGLNVANGFLENNYLSCESLKGYHGIGSGD